MTTSPTGPFNATLFFIDGSGAEGAGVPVDEGGWVAAAPPDFAPDLLPVVSLEDVAFDALHRAGRIALPNPITYVRRHRTGLPACRAPALDA